MTDGSGTPPCFLFYYQYDGYNPTHDTCRFTIHCTLEKGAEAYYSGVRVVVIAKNIGCDDNFARAEIRARRLGGKHMLFTEKHVEIELPEETNEVVDYHVMSVDGLPLYTLILELVDLSDAIWRNVEIRFPAAAETSSPGPLQQIPDTHRILYECAKRTSGHSPSCVFFLTTWFVGLGRSHKQHGPFRLGRCPYPILPTHGFRILPLSEKRPFFTQPPPEVLYNIISFLAHDGNDWRTGLAAVSLVCRAWWEVALSIIYKDFEFDNQWREGSRIGELPKPQIGRLAMTLKDNSEWGRYIKRFSLRGTATQYGDNALTVLKTAPNMRRLSVGNVSTVLAGEFIEAICEMTKLRYFTQFVTHKSWMMIDEDSAEKINLNAAQLTKCFAHWPNLRQATVEGFGKPHAEDGTEFAPARCALDQIKFERGLVSMAQLRAITASSRGTLHTVVLRYIEGISNKEFKSWLLEFGPNLTDLTLECNVFTPSEADEFTIDATIHRMPKLLHLEIEGPVTTVLATLLRFEPTQAMKAEITIHNPLPFDLRAFVKALYMTKWGMVDVSDSEDLVVSDENSELIEEALRVAEERGIELIIQC